MSSVSDPKSALQFFQTRMPDGTYRVLLFERSNSASSNIGNAVAFVIDFGSANVFSAIDSGTIANYIRNNQDDLLARFREAKALGKAYPLTQKLGPALSVATAGYSLIGDLQGDWQLTTDQGFKYAVAGSIAKFFYSVGTGIAIGEIVLASTAFGAAFGPLGAGIGLLGGLLFAGAASFAVASSANNVKAIITRLLDPVDHALRVGGDIVVTAPIAMDPNSRIAIYDPKALATNPALKAAVDGVKNDSGPLADYLAGRTATLNVPGLGGVARSLTNGRENITLTAQGFTFTESLPIGASEDEINAAINGLQTKVTDEVGRHLTTAPDVGTYQSVSTLAAMFGSTLGRYIGGSNPLASVLASSALGTITQNLGQAIVVGGLDRPVVLRTGAGRDINAVTKVADNVLDDFGSEFIANLQSAALGTVSSMLAAELGHVLGLKGFGAELFTTSSSSVIGQVVTNAFNITHYGTATPGLVGQAGDAGKNLFHGFNSQGLFGSVDKAGVAQPGLLTGAIGSYFGAKLGSLILSPINTEGAILSSLGSAAGVFALTSGATSLGIGSFAASLTSAFGSIANLAVPFVGSLVGFLLGSLIGRLFGRPKPRIPTASAEIALNIGTGRWDLGAVTSANNGNRQLVATMARTARDGINSLISVVSATADQASVSNTIEERQRYGHTGNTLYFDEKVGSSFVRRYSGTSADVATEMGILSGIKATRLVGGDIFVKRAVYGVSTDDTASLVGNMQIADDFSKYVSKPQPINQLISQAPQSSFSAGWAITLLRAEELGLNQYRPSDFFGGLRGFASSFGFGASGAFEALQLGWEGANLRISATDGSSPFQSISFNNFAYAGQSRLDAGRSALVENFGSNVGYTAWTGQATAGNDIWVAAGGGSVTMDDMSSQQGWRYNPVTRRVEPYTVQVSGGDDIFVGSAYADTLYGRAGWDWLDGGAGNDVIDGGENDDVLLGRAGNDRLLGGNGNDYLAGGDGDDYFYDVNRTWGLYGGEGNDVLVGGAGTDALYGENGDDVFIVDQDGGSTWDALTGQGGSDTLSYERFTSGVYIDFANLGGWSWDPTAKYIYGDAIAGSMENVTGTAFADTILGDSGSNVLRGLMGNDNLSGRDGDDFLEGGAGADTLDGGGGSDTASYRNASERVSIDLTVGKGYLGEAEGDVFYNIENATGTIYADSLKGSTGDNILNGLDGDDQIVFTAGNDMANGGNGLDTIDASTATSAINIYDDAGYSDPYYGYYQPGAGFIASVSGMGTTLLNSVERFVGSRFGDSISGTPSDEIYEGGAGNDYLTGGGGADTYVLNRGDGQDTAYDYGTDANSILLGNGINWRDVSIAGANYAQQNGSLTVAIRGTSDQMVVGSNFSYVNSGNSAGQHNHAIKSLNLGGVSTVDIDMIDWTPYAADENGTTVYGAQNRADLIFAYGGNDTIYTAGNSYAYESRGNVVYAGDGNDTIYSSYGDDQFIFERGNGIDTLTDNGGADTIVMGPSVAADNVIYQVVGGDLYIGIRDASNPNTVASQVADRIRVVGGGTKTINANYGYETFNTIEHVRVGGQEIDLTKANINWTVAYDYSGGYYPIALDLDGDGIELRSVEGSRIASVQADGTVTRMGWLGQDDGFLALDRDGNGVIDRIGEISFIGDKEGAKTDLEGLATYDSNGDGTLDASDKRWGEFKVWQDRNQDGFGSKDELVTLDKAGIASISLKGQATGFTRADGFDNTVIATTEIGWTDKSRTGSAHDVMLAWRQVRTDGGARDLVAADALARGAKVDDIEARLHGSQSLSEEQVKAIREKQAQAKGQGDGGRLYRIEDLLGGAPGKLVAGTSLQVEGAAAKTVDGLLSIDPALASKVVAGSRALGLIDRYAGSDWTKLGSIAPGKADLRGVVTTVEKRDLSVEQKAVIADARRIVAERKLADEAKAAALVAKDAADAVLRPAPTPPTAAELERLKQTDKFRVLEGGKTSDAADGDTADIDADAIERDLMRQFATAAAPEVLQEAPADPVAEDTAAQAPVSEAAPTTADADASPARPASASDVARDNATLPDLESYGVVIRTANARLVQALASFGDAPAMMARYQGLDVANDAQAAWLSVDAMPSVQRLAAIR